MNIYRRLAPAKLNLTLEILGKRADGYHEIRSVVTTLSLADEVTVEAGSGFVVSADEEYDATGMSFGGEANTVETALALMAAERARRRGEPVDPPDAQLRRAIAGVAVRLYKRIPAAAGLGGGSSDGAATLRLLNDAWQLGLGATELVSLAKQIGSDCPMFIDGGVQLMSGRGELLHRLPLHAEAWFCIVRPPVVRPGKTALLYSLVKRADYGDGGRTAALVRRLEAEDRRRLCPEELSNVFDGIVDRAFGSLEMVRSALRSAGADAVHVCGSGPALYGLFSDESRARAAEQALSAEGYAAWAVLAPCP